MSLSIDIAGEQDQPCYKPGSKISGRVKLVSKRDESISSVTLIFSGRCKVKIRESIHYTTRTFRSRGYYFIQKVVVFNGGGFTHKAGEYAWPFSFTVPYRADKQSDVPVIFPPSRPKRHLDAMGMMQIDDERGLAHDFFPAQSPWHGTNDRRAHYLPDSFRTSHTQRSVSWEARVEYMLIGKLERPTVGSKLFSGAKELEVATEVGIRSNIPPNMDNLLAQRQTLTFEKTVMFARAPKPSDNQTTSQQSSRRLAEKAWAKIRPSPSDTLDLSISIETARFASTSNPLPFIIAVSLNSKVSTPLEDSKSVSSSRVVPVVKLNNCDMCITCRTWVRDDSRAASEHTASQTERFRVLSQKGMDVTVLDENDSQPATLHLDLSMHTLIPSFSTYNIAREYVLDFELEFQCMGETLTLSDTSAKVIIIPSLQNTESHTPPPSLPAEPTPDYNRGQAEGDSKLAKETEAHAEAHDQQLADDGLGEGLPAYQP